MTVSGTANGILQISAATGSDCSSALGLDGPVEPSHLGVGETARTATLVLNVV